MRLMMDACILYPTVLREILIGLAKARLYTPLWSPRILEEWARAAARTGVEDVARAEIALLRAGWPKAEIVPEAEVMATLSLPDEDDVHVLAAAIAGRAEAVLTVNLRDFPGRTLARHGLTVRTPDILILEFLEAEKDTVTPVVEAVRARTETLSGRPQPLRPLLKRAGLPRTAKRLAPASASP